MGKIVHTKGNFGSKGVARGAVCRTCPGSCWTECMRAGVRSGNTGQSTESGFSISFNIEESAAEIPEEETEDAAALH